MVETRVKRVNSQKIYQISGFILWQILDTIIFAFSLHLRGNMRLSIFYLPECQLTNYNEIVVCSWVFKIEVTVKQTAALSTESLGNLFIAV